MLTAHKLAAFTVKTEGKTPSHAFTPLADPTRRLLTIAARNADIIGLTGSKVRAVDDPFAERIDFVRNATRDRVDSLELNLAITAMPRLGETEPDLKLTRSYALDLSYEEILSQLSVLSGSPRAIADTLLAYREKYGVSSFTVQDNNIDNFAKVIAELR